jgi:hypothetical protein
LQRLGFNFGGVGPGRWQIPWQGQLCRLKQKRGATQFALPLTISLLPRHPPKDLDLFGIRRFIGRCRAPIEMPFAL